jgi:hypothetical protein
LATARATANFIVALQEQARFAGVFSARYLWELINDAQNINWQNINSSTTPVWGLPDTNTASNWQNGDTSTPPGWDAKDTSGTNSWQVTSTV